MFTLLLSSLQLSTISNPVHTLRYETQGPKLPAINHVRRPFYVFMKIQTINSCAFPKYWAISVSDCQLDRVPTLSSKMVMGTSLVFQWLRLQASNVGGTGSNPGQGTKIPHTRWTFQKHLFKIKVSLVQSYFLKIKR